MVAPRVIMIAGPNGAGKTTFAREFLPQEARLPRFINADLIAAGLSPFAPEAAAVKAGRLMLQEIAECTARRESFALETTLAGMAYLQHIRRWQASGYGVSLYFLNLPSAEVAIERVAERVRQGGHHIPEDVIRRRFGAGRRNFEGPYRAAVDAWMKFDSASQEHTLLDSLMDEKDLARARNRDRIGAHAAIKRAARSARELAVRTNTAVVNYRPDVGIVRTTADELLKAGYK